MSHIELSHVSVPASRRFGGFFARAWAAYSAARQRQAAIADLHSLDDRSLRDIGLHRSEIEWAVEGRRGHDLE
ncbi:MAG: DUF1127 domain-containing protein [Pseudomonadota bacterium]|nr:DUF1127 domain-containing protein [Pseudomonadota bacterium]